MKNHRNPARVLILGRETIRQLSSVELRHAGGGGVTDMSQGTACRTVCTPCTGSGGTVHTLE